MLFITKHVEILLAIDDETTIADVAKKSKTTYSHTFKAIGTMLEHNLVKKEGRVVSLTQRGLEVRDKIMQIKKLL